MRQPDAIAEHMSPLAASASELAIQGAATIAATGMPLPAGLRATAQEADSWRVAAGLRHLAAELERGRSLEDCLAEVPSLPRYVSALIRAAQRTGDMGATLAAWTVNR